MKLKNGIAAFAFTALLLGGANIARAACSNPTQPEGYVLYNQAEHVLQFCNGTKWIAVSKCDGGGTGCTGPTQPEGYVMYNQDHHKMQYCNGASWIAIGPLGCASTPLCHVTSGLVGHWKLNETSGTSAADSSGYGNTGALQNMELADWVTGKIGGGLNFDGDAATEYASISASSSLNISGPVSICAWVNATAFTSGEEDMILGNGNTTPISQYYLSTDDAASTTTKKILLGWSNNAGTFKSYRSSGTISSGSWTHVCGVRTSNSSVQIYINGASQATSIFDSSSATPTTSSLPVSIGRAGSYNDLYWNGAIDDVRIYNHALSSGEVSAIYNSGTGCSESPDYTSNLIGYWPLSEGTGTTTADASGAGNNGTLTGGPPVPVWTSGKQGGALQFQDSPGNYVNMGDINAMDGLTQMTASAWVKSNSAGANNYEAHWLDKSQCDGNLNSGPFELYGVDSMTGPAFAIYPAGGTPSNYISSGNSLTNVDDGNWHLVTGTYDGNILAIYVDGVLKNSNTIGAITMSSNAKTVSLGGDCNGSNYFWNGKIDEARVYSRALSPADIAALYAAGGP